MPLFLELQRDLKLVEYQINSHLMDHCVLVIKSSKKRKVVMPFDEKKEINFLLQNKEYKKVYVHTIDRHCERCKEW